MNLVELYKGILIYEEDDRLCFREGNKITGKFYKEKHRMNKNSLDNARKTIDLYINHES